MPKIVRIKDAIIKQAKKQDDTHMTNERKRNKINKQDESILHTMIKYIDMELQMPCSKMKLRNKNRS
jgi:hypothetical protein